MIEEENKALTFAEKLINETNNSIFLTGKAGTGKSTFLRKIARESEKSLVVLAPTGIASINAKGQTIHSFFKVPFGPLQPADARLRKIKFKPEKAEIIENLELLIIDEISMVRADVLDAIDFLLRKVRKIGKPFGGVQVLFVGDLFQLEPVMPKDEAIFLDNFYRSPYFFNAWVFNEIDIVNLELQKIYRQTDEHFIGLLNKVRAKKAAYDDLIQLNNRPKNPAFDDKNFYITLCTTRRKAKEINDAKLIELKEEEFVFAGEIKDKFPMGSLPTDLNLKLKNGAQVIFIQNDYTGEKKYVNGSLGKIVELSEDTIKVELENGKLVEVEQTFWENLQYKFNPEKNKIEDEVVGTFTQYPLKLAWAITIHKSQGLTFDHVIVDLDRGAFAAGQLYVALSRCTSIEGLILKTKIRQSDIIVRQEVLDYYTKMNDRTQLMKAINSRN
ncbi:MAG: ATP-dependent DNA helicase [Chitinophagales bacterium]